MTLPTARTQGGDARRRVLVTGATGFVGRSMVHRLSTSSSYVVRAALRQGPVDGRGDIERVLSGPATSVTDWRLALEGVDLIVHLAARNHVMRDEDPNPLGAFRLVNVDGTLNLARQAAASGRVRRFVFMSSVKVNGEATTDAPFTERDRPDPRNPYGTSKYEAEEGLKRLATESGMAVTIIRPPLVYGPNAPGNFGRLVRLVQSGLPLPLGAVHNRRSLVAMDNLVDFSITCLEHPAAANETFLVSDGEDLSTTDLLRRLARVMGRRARLVPVPASILLTAARVTGRQDMAQRLLGSLQVDAAKARKVLGWVAPVSVDEGLRRAV